MIRAIGVRRALLAAAIAVAPNTAAAQSVMTASMPETAGACLAAFRADRSPSRVATAHRCADFVVRHGVRTADIAMLATLYDSAQDSARARAHLLLRDLGVAMTQTEYSGARLSRDLPTTAALAAADSAAARLDALPASVSDLQLRAHRKLLADATALSDRRRTIHHARRVIDLARQMRPRTTEMNLILLYASADLAQAFGDVGDLDSAFAILDRARNDVDSATYARTSLPAMRFRYSLVGHVAPPIEANRWFNAPDEPHSIAIAPGKVTLVQFTAEDCPPCRASYPTMRSLVERYDRSQFDLVFVAPLWGVFAGKDVNMADEIALNRDYYLNRQHIGVPIALVDGKNDLDPTRRRYGFVAVPQFVLVDRRGVVRRVMLGWDSTTAAPLERLIAELIAAR